MNLEELRKAMESDATVKNKELKAEIEKLKSELEEEKRERRNEKNGLLDDCRALANRCFALTLGTTCMFCELRAYRCPRALSVDEKFAAAKKLMEENKNEQS